MINLIIILGFIVLLGWFGWLFHLYAVNDQKERESLEQKLMARDYAEYKVFTGEVKKNRSVVRSDEDLAKIGEKKETG